jgi:hypothetical protein
MPSNIKHIQNLEYINLKNSNNNNNNNNNKIYSGAVLVGCLTPRTVLQSTVNLVKEEACTPNHLATSP